MSFASSSGKLGLDQTLAGAAAGGHQWLAAVHAHAAASARASLQVNSGGGYLWLAGPAWQLLRGTGTERRGAGLTCWEPQRKERN